MDCDDGRWSCAQKQVNVVQSIGCADHRYIPILLERFATQTDYVNGDVMYATPDGEVFGNGDNPGSLKSVEIRAMEAKSLLGGVAKLKKDLEDVGIGSEVIK